MKTSLFRLSGKALVIVAAATLAAPTVNAQDEVGARFGIKLAPNMAWLRPDVKGVKNDGSKLGYTFGLNMEFPIGSSGNYRFATGLFLNNVGGKITQDYVYKETPTGPELTKALAQDMTLRYIELPLTLKLMTNEIGYMRYYGQIGMGAAFNIRAKADYDQPVLDPSGAYTTGFTTLEDEDIKDDIALFKASLIIGGGMEYNFSGNTALQVGITYNNGFTNVLDGAEVNGKKAKVYQDYLELNLGVFF